MCEPATAVVLIGSAISAGTAIAGHISQNSAANKNARAANKATASDLDSLSLREAQERDVSTGSILDIERQVAQAQGTAAVNAGEAGVSGASVQALLSIIQTRGSEAVLDVQQGFSDTKRQIGNEKTGVLATRASRIAAVPRASNVETGLRVGGAALDAYTGLRGNRPIRGGGG